MSFFRNATGLLLTSTVSIPLAFLTTVVLARWLSVADRGLYSVAMTYVAATVMVGQLGWPSASVYRLRRLKSPPAQVLGAGVIPMLSSSIVIIVVSLLFAPSIEARLLVGAPPGLFQIALAIIPAVLIAMLLGGIAQGIDYFRYHNIAQIGRSIGLLSVTGGVLIYLRLGVVAALTSVLVVYTIATIWLFIAVVRRTGFTLRIEREELADGFRYGLRAWVYGLGGQIHERVDIFMISALLGDPEQVAFYAVAVGVVERLKMVPASLGSAAYAQMAEQEPRQAAAFVCGVSRQLVAIMVAGVPALAVIAYFLVPRIYGAPYLASIPPTLILLPAMAFHALFRILAFYFAAIDHQRVNIQIQFSAIVANLILNFVLIPRYGIQGAAAASFLSYSLEAILMVIVFARITGRSVSEFTVFGLRDLEPLRRRFTAYRGRLRIKR